jgi:hypothetical protein
MSGFLATLIFSFALTRLPCAAAESQAKNLANLNSSQTGVVVVSETGNFASFRSYMLWH